MKCNHIGDCRTIDSYVKKKLDALSRTDRSFADLFEFMFSEKDVVLYERSVGYKIVKTTYAEAHDRALSMAVGLRARLADAPHDAVVGVYMENGVEWIETLWAVLAAGFCPLLLNLRLDPAVLERTMAECGAVAVITDKGTFSLPTIPYTDMIPTADAPHAVAEFDFGSRLYVMSTGTSTHVKACSYGAPEFACLVSDSAYIVKVCRQIKQHYKGSLKLLAFLPFYHVFGLIAMYVWFAFFSSTFVHLNDLEPQTILNTVRRHEVTHIFAVPLFWERIYDAADRTIRARGEETVRKYEKGLAIGRKLDGMPAVARAFRRAAFKEVREQLFGESVQFMITGGSPIRPEALAFFNDIGYHLTNGYGMTEIGITSVELSMSARQRKSASVGKPLPSISYRINEKGELLVQGASLAATIRQGDRETVRREGDWFATGDLAECIDGSYRILGRADDLILLPNGEMLNPNLIEPAYITPETPEACLINPAEGSTPAPTLLLSVAREVSRDRLAALETEVSDKLKAARLDTQIKKVVFVPGTLLGATDFKLNRLSITRRYVAGEFAAISANDEVAMAPETDLEARVAAVFATSLGIDPSRVGVDSDFFTDLGGSSLDYFAMISALKETFGLPFEETEGTDFHTVHRVCRYMEDNGRHDA